MQPIDPHILFDDEEEDDREVGYTPESIETDDPVLRFALHAMIADVLSLIRWSAPKGHRTPETIHAELDKRAKKEALSLFSR